MKTINVLIFGLFAVLLLVPSFGWCQANIKNDNYGKIIGQLVDESTGKPISEKFKIGLYDLDTRRNTQDPVETDINGKFSFTAPVGKYYIMFMSTINKTRYTRGADEFSTEWYKDKPIFEIKKGQITKIRKVIKLAGSLKVQLVDQNGNLLSPKAHWYDNADVIALLKSQFLGDNYSEGDKIDAGGAQFYGLYPTTYNLKIQFRNIGYGPIEKDNIAITKEANTDIKITVDLSNSTGIEGRLLAKNGSPIQGGEISIYHEDIRLYDVECLTDGYGYYKIIGLKEGKYHIALTCINSRGVRVMSHLKSCIVVNNQMTKYDITAN